MKDIEVLDLNTQRKLVQLFRNGANPDINITFDFRLIALSSLDLSTLVDKGEFDYELFDFINKAFIEIPDLKNRSDDVEALINYFLKMECRKQGLLLKAFSPRLVEEFSEYEWPGNISELKRYVERAVTLSPRDHIINEINDLTIPKLKKAVRGLKLFDDIKFASQSDLSLKDRMSLIERKIIDSEIKRVKGNKSKAAKEMGISREALRKKLLHSDEILTRLETGNNTVEKKAA